MVYCAVNVWNLDGLFVALWKYSRIQRASYSIRRMACYVWQAYCSICKSLLLLLFRSLSVYSDQNSNLLEFKGILFLFLLCTIWMREYVNWIFFFFIICVMCDFLLVFVLRVKLWAFIVMRIKLNKLKGAKKFGSSLSYGFLLVLVVLPILSGLLTTINCYSVKSLGCWFDFHLVLVNNIDVIF